jgi:hypothetical protein
VTQKPTISQPLPPNSLRPCAFRRSSAVKNAQDIRTTGFARRGRAFFDQFGLNNIVIEDERLGLFVDQFIGCRRRVGISYTCCDVTLHRLRISARRRSDSADAQP